MSSSLPRPILRRRPKPTRIPVETLPEPTRIEVIEAASLRWVNVERPQPADRDWLEAEYGFHPLDFEDVFSRNERPKLDAYEDYLFIVLQYPLFDPESGRVLTTEVDVFVGPDFLITLPNEPFAPLRTLFDRYRGAEDERLATFSKGSGYLLYEIVDAGVDAAFPMLRKIGLKLERLEDELFAGRSGQIVRELSNVKQEIINFRRIVRPQLSVLIDLERTKQRYLADELEIYFDDIRDAAERVWDLLENYKEVAEGLESTNESVLSHQLSDALRVLTGVSVILLPLTLVASIFGMNVAVPGEGDRDAFWAILGVMALMLFGLVVAFRRRGWL